MNKKLKFALVFLVALAAGLFLLDQCAPEAEAATAPDFVAHGATTGFVKLTSGDIDATHGLSILQVHAVAEVEISFWNLNSAGDDLVKWKPKWGDAATDTTIIIAAGTTQTFRFPFPRPVGCYISAGTANLSGE